MRHKTLKHMSVAMVSGLVETLLDDARSQLPVSKKSRKRSVQQNPLKIRSSPRNSRMSAAPEATPSVNVLQEVGSIGTSSVDSEQELKDNNSGVEKLALFKCQLCEFKSGYKHSLERHIQKKHELLDEVLYCPRSFCSLTFTTRWAKEQHVAQCLLVCQREECGKLFDRKDKFQQHIRMHKRMDDKYLTLKHIINNHVKFCLTVQLEFK